MGKSNRGTRCFGARLALVGSIVCVILPLAVRAQFSTVINVPPTVIGDFQSIGSSTQVNVSANGSVGYYFQAGATNGSSTNIQLNISGGNVREGLSAYGSSTTVNISGGTVGGNFRTDHGAKVNITGGHLAGSLDAQNSTVTVSGGLIGDGFSVESESTLTIFGNDFRQDGQAMTWIGGVGSTWTVFPLYNYPGGLSGTLADGTPFMLSSRSDFDSITVPITLKIVALPAVGPAVIHVPVDPAPTSIRGGQSLTLDAGGTLGSDFQAGYGSHVVVNGGIIRNGFEATGTTLEVHGGTIEHDFNVFEGTATIDGGAFDSFFAGAFSQVNVSSGSFGDFVIGQDANVQISGGLFGGSFYSGFGSSTTLSGGDFQIDGVPVAGLGTIGNTVVPNIPDNAVLSGTLADGSPFAFARGEINYFDDGTLTLKAAAVPPAAPATYDVPSGPAPRFLRNGQTATVSTGGDLGNGFLAAAGSSVTIDGGTVGNAFEAMGSRVTMTSGEIGEQLVVLSGAVVDIRGGTVGQESLVLQGGVLNISGGTIGRALGARAGGVINITGGSIGQSFHPGAGSRVSISGGSIADYLFVASTDFNVSGGTIGPNLQAYTGSTINICGGQIGNSMSMVSETTLNVAGGHIGTGLTTWDGDVINFSGGSIGDGLRAVGANTYVGAPGVVVNIFGKQFSLGGVDITSTLSPNSAMTISTRNTILAGVLADGTPFDFSLNSNSSQSGDYFATTATVRITLVNFLPGDFNRNGTVETNDYVLWRKRLGSTVTKGTNGDANFDGKVTYADFDIWRTRLGRVYAPGVGSNSLAVPEPGIAMWLFVASFLATRRSRTGKMN